MITPLKALLKKRITDNDLSLITGIFPSDFLDKITENNLDDTVLELADFIARLGNYSIEQQKVINDNLLLAINYAKVDSIEDLRDDEY